MSALPMGWVETTLGEFVSKLRTGPFGSSVHKTDYIEGGIPLINPMHINNGKIAHSQNVTVSKAKARDLSEFTLKLGDIIIGRRGEMGRCAVIAPEQEGWLIGTGSMGITTNSALQPNFLQRFLASPISIVQLTERSIGSTMVNLNQSILLGLPIAVPPLPEQQRIVAKVDALMTRTARARKDLAHIPTLITRYKQRLLATLFEDFSRKVPKHRLGDLAQFVTSGSRGWAQYYSDEGDLFVRVGNVMRETINLDFEKLQYVKPPSNAEGQRTRLQQNDILITITADLGRIGVFDDERTAYINQHVALCRLKDPQASKFIALYLTSEIGQAQLVRNTRGATKAAIGLDDIRDVEIPLPPLPEQEEIVRRVETAFAWLDRLAAEHTSATKLLPKLDAAILTKAFTGHLVPQNPTDEPASVLLARVKAERAAMPKQGRGRKVAA